MKGLIGFIMLSLLSGSICGCATPLKIDNGSQSRVFTPCTNNNLCFRDSYNVAWDNWHYYNVVAWDNWHYYNIVDYPVSYRTKQSEYESNKVEYILLNNQVIEQVQFGGAR